MLNEAYGDNRKSTDYGGYACVVEDIEEVDYLEVVGQRKCEFNYNINTDITENRELYKIYEWISTDGNAMDKAIIARNIISLYSQFTSIIEIDAKTFSFIQSNFKLYQKDNVDKYIEVKNKVAEYILEIVNSTSNIVV